MDGAEEAGCFNTEAEIDEEVLKLQDAVVALEDRVAILRSNVSWGYVRAGNAYAKPPLVKPKTEALVP